MPSKGVDIAETNVLVIGAENKVVGGEVKDLGVIRLKRNNEVFGNVDVTVRHDDGTPVDPMYVQGVEWQPVAWNSHGPYQIPWENLGQPGVFRMRLPVEGIR